MKTQQRKSERERMTIGNIKGVKRGWNNYNHRLTSSSSSVYVHKPNVEFKMLRFTHVGLGPALHSAFFHFTVLSVLLLLKSSSVMRFIFPFLPFFLFHIPIPFGDSEWLFVALNWDWGGFHSVQLANLARASVFNVEWSSTEARVCVFGKSCDAI